MKVVRFIIQLIVINRIINPTAVQSNMSYTFNTHQLEVSTSMIKTNHLSWHVIVFIDEMPNFIIDYELRFWVYKKLVIYIFCDNSRAVAQYKDLRNHKKGKHIESIYHIIRDIVARGDVIVVKIDGANNLADPFTKVLP